MDWDEIPQLYTANYRVSMPWRSVEKWIVDNRKDKVGCILEPDFQRGRVWSEAKQCAYVEYCLSGGTSSREIQWNCPGWMEDFRGPMVLVDGLQRITSVRMFINSELKAFGMYYKDFYGNRIEPQFLFFVNHLVTKREVLEWYIQLNRGGVVHTDEEISRVEGLLEREKTGKVKSKNVYI